MSSRSEATNAAELIAIVGSSCRFPGGASSPSKLWQLLKNPKDLLSEFPKERLGLKAFYHEDGEHHGSTNVVPKAYLLEEDPRLFDAPFFNINPMEADACDPQHRLLMESVYECIESAGCSLESMQGSSTSVYVGCMTNDYHDIQGRDLETINRYHGTGSTESILSNRLSYFFDLRGPSVTINTACSSSLAALHFAVQSLRNGESTAAIVGGVNLIFDTVPYISESKLHMLSPNSRSSMWDASADGYARGEGVSALMVKTLSRALADGDSIECIIRETGMNQDGRTTGMTMPSGDSQAALIRETYARAGLDLNLRGDRPQFFEAHGTGTLAGDPQEARGIYSAFFQQASNGQDRAEQEEVLSDDKLYCGSIKTIIGHLEGCAGLAGLLKASLAVQNGIIPPNLLFKNLNPEIAPYYHRLHVPTQALKWPSGTSPRRASGTNVHAIVEEYIPSSPAPRHIDQYASDGEDFFAGPLLLSACTPLSLAANINALADVLEEDRTNIDDLAFFSHRRTTFQQRIWFPGGSRRGLIEALRNATAKPEDHKDLGVRAPVKLKWNTPGILGVFTGQGAQWPTMGRDLVNRCYTFRKSLEACEAALGVLPDAPSWSLVQELCQEQSQSRLHEAALAQPLCTAIQIALVDTLASAGITFRGVVGHSSGEIGAAYAAGLLSAEDAIRVAYYRGLYAHLAHGGQGQQGAMLAVGMGPDDAEAFCLFFAGRISVAASNSPTSTTLSGDKDAILETKTLLEADGKFARLLKVDTAYHSHHMLPCAEPYLTALRALNIKVRLPNDNCIWISSVHGHAELLDDPVGDLAVLADEYWVANMCQPVLFYEAVECSLTRAGPFDMALEVGAHPALKGPASQTITAALGANSALPYAGTLQRGYNDVAAFSSSLGSLWTIIGNWMDFNGWRRAMLGPGAAPVTPVCKAMPKYSWSHDQIYWRESRISRRYRLAERAPHELLGRRAADDGDGEMRWRNILKVAELPWTRGHVFQRSILFPTVGYVSMAIEAAAEIAGGVHRIRLIEVNDVTIPRALALEDNHNSAETVFSVRRRPTDDDTVIEADFAFYSSVNNGSLEKNCSGGLRIDLLATDESSDGERTPLLPSRCPPRSGTTSIEGEAYYQAIFNTTGLDYTGLFRGVKHIRRTLGFSTAKSSWTAEDVGNKYILHPGPFDVALQAILAAFVNPTRIPIRGSFLPSALSRLVFDPHASALSDDGKEVIFESDCFLTTNTARSVEGDIHVFGPSGRCLFQAEGFRMDNWTESIAAEDRPVFSRLEYKPDIFYANANNLPELMPDETELRVIEAVNRASFFYLRNFFCKVTDSEIAGWTWDRQAFCKAARRVIQQTLDGTHPTTNKSWMHDSEALMHEYKQVPAFQESADLKAIHVAGEHLSKVMASEERCLEVYLRENVWAPLYSHGRYQVHLNHTIADLVSTFAHRFPRAKYLEVGAGSAGTTIGILNQLGDALGQYTFTDISAGFFEKARERLSHTQAAANDRVVYSTLDLERDPLEQGFEAQSQDVIIAANVLHATADLTKAVRNVRRLLKPGGYLFMLEVTGEYLGGLLLMGPLEGWWLGNREGSASQPGLTLQGWDDLFRNNGFSGVDRYQSDVPDATKHAVSVVVTQAIDSKVDILREPLEYLDDLPVCDQVLIVGGQSLTLSKTVRTISQYVSRFAGRVQIVPSVDKMETSQLHGPTAVIALCDLERVFFADPVTEERLRNLQDLFAHATDMLWVTTGHLDNQDPSAAMMIGLCRTVVLELEQLNLQFLNVAAKGSRQVDARVIAETFVRLKLGGSDEFRASPAVWDVEPELTLTSDGEIMIPRLKPDQERNDRCNSSARRITKTVKGSDMNGRKYTALSRGGSIHLEDCAPWAPTENLYQMDPEADTITLRSTLTLTLPHSTSAVLVAGIDVNSNEPALVVTREQSSLISVPRASVLYLPTAMSFTAELMRICAHMVVARHILGLISARSFSQESQVVIHGASAALVNAVTHLKKGKSKIWFTQSTTSDKARSANSIYLHPKSSNYVLRRSLPSDIGFVVVLVGGDPVADKLKSMFAGHSLDLDAVLLQGDFLSLSACNDSIIDSLKEYGSVLAVEQAMPIPVSQLPGSSGSSLNYPAVIDWSPKTELPLQITVKPINGRGLVHAHKTYFMVGLVSTLGRSICRWMVENGARHIALASRSGNVDPQWLEEMEHLGANVRIYRMDISNKLSVQETVAKVRTEMPPIAGVANAALTLRDRPFVDMTAEELNEVLAPKVDGSLHLHQEFIEPGLDWFILFSTLSCVIGNPGQSNYDAASLYQVMLAKQRRQKGLPASVMEVGVVSDVGYVAERGDSLFQKLSRTMKLALSESDVHQIFAEAIAASPVREGEVVDSTTAELVTGMGYHTHHANTPSETHPPWFNNRLASHFVREEKASATVVGASDGDHLSVATRLQSTNTEEEAAAVLTNALAARVEAMLQMASGSFKVDISLLEMGIDSLLAVELRTWFLKQIGVDVPVLKILGGDSGQAICTFAASQYLAEKSRSNPGKATAEGAASPQTSDLKLEREESANASSSDGKLTPSEDSSLLEDLAMSTSVSTVATESHEGYNEKCGDTTPLPTVRSTAPMTPAQARLWVADQMSSNCTQNNNLLTYDVHGFIHIARLRRALATVIAHHPGLHTCFFEDDTNRPVQGLLENPADCFDHVSVGTESAQSGEGLRKVQDELRLRKWALQRGDVVKLVLVSESDNKHALVIGFHHIAMDGTSWRSFFRDLHMAYQGMHLQPLGKSLVDVAIEKPLGPVDDFWQEQLSPAPEPFPLLPFATKKVRPPLDGYANHSSLIELPGAVAEGINAASRSAGVTSVNLFLAAVQCLLSRLADVEDICIGVTDSGRDAETAETIGFFINMLPLRLRMASLKSFGELLLQVNKTYREARAHSAVSFDTILDGIGVSRDPTHTPLFQVAFDLRPGQSVDKIPLGNCHMTVRDSVDSALPYDICFCVVPMPTSGPSYVQVLTRADLYSLEATELLGQMYVTLLESVVQPSAVNSALAGLPIYPGSGIRKALENGMPERRAFPDWTTTITDRMEQICQNHAATTAIKDVSGPLSYAELAQAVMSLAVRLLPHQEQCIAVLCEPQRVWMIGMLATFRIGAAFVSLDATLPASRLTAMIKECTPSVVLCNATTQPLACQVVHDCGSSAQVLAFENTPATSEKVGNLEDPSKTSLIYFTSGTTGVPKSIMLSSRGVINTFASVAELHGVRAGDVVLQQSNLGFDMALAQVLLALTNGGTLVIAPQASRGDPVALTDLMVQENVSVTFACPTEYCMWLHSDYSRDNLLRMSDWRLAFYGGERCPETFRRDMHNLSKSLDLVEAYGPTEVSVMATIQRKGERPGADPLAAASTSVGRPLFNHGVLVLDSNGRACPPGIPGEICVTGANIALGYLDAEATAQTFVEKVQIEDGNGAILSLGRMYKTGDRGVWRSDGTLGFLERMTDNTVVKLRGLRIDLKDVEHAILLQGSHLIAEVVVTKHQHEDDSFLAAHVVSRRPSTGHRSDSNEEDHQENNGAIEGRLEDFMQRLDAPRHMKPSRVIVLARMPTNANGKLDRKGLASAPLPPRHSCNLTQLTVSEQDRASISTMTQIELHLLWRRVLDRDIPRRSDIDFWALGGSSLSLVKLQAAIQRDMLVKLSIRDMFLHSTLGSMADLLTTRSTSSLADQPIDWDQETSLTDNLRAVLSSAKANKTTFEDLAPPTEVLLTGADGFLGDHILQALLRDPLIRRVHCVGIPASTDLLSNADSERIVVYSGSLYQHNLGLTEDAVASLAESVNCIIAAGSQGHCLNNYASLRQPNVTSTKFLATLAARHRIPLHFISSSRVTLLHEDAEAALPPVSVKDHPPQQDGSAGFTASKWASEAFLERVADEAGRCGKGFSITVHRPCALVGSEAPSDDALNALLRFSDLMCTVPRVSSLPISGYFDFAPVEDVAARIVEVALGAVQAPRLLFRHHSGDVKVEAKDFKAHMERVYGKHFSELELECWLRDAMALGFEPLVATYLRAAMESGQEIIFPFMGTPGAECERSI